MVQESAAKARTKKTKRKNTFTSVRRYSKYAQKNTYFKRWKPFGRESQLFTTIVWEDPQSIIQRSSGRFPAFVLNFVTQNFGSKVITSFCQRIDTAFNKEQKSKNLIILTGNYCCQWMRLNKLPSDEAPNKSQYFVKITPKHQYFITRKSGLGKT